MYVRVVSKQAIEEVLFCCMPERGELWALGDSAACAVRIIEGSRQRRKQRRLSPSHASSLFRILAFGSFVPLRARCLDALGSSASFDSQRNAHMRCRQIRSNQSKSSPAPTCCSGPAQARRNLPTSQQRSGETVGKPSFWGSKARDPTPQCSIPLRNSPFSSMKTVPLGEPIRTVGVHPVVDSDPFGPGGPIS